MMASFALGITRGFNLMEESGYLARVSFLFDRTMSKAGLRGKSIMPFCMGLGCTIAGTTGARVVDYWMQRVPAIAMSWAVSYAAILSVVPAIVIAPFGSTGGFLVMVSIFLYMLIWIACRAFGATLATEKEQVRLIMELPPITGPPSGTPCIDPAAYPGHLSAGSARHLGRLHRVLCADLRFRRQCAE